MNLRIGITLALSLLLGLTGCATAPTVDRSKIGSPKSVAIVMAPTLRYRAVFGVYATQFEFHFTPRSDQFFSYVAPDPARSVESGGQTAALGATASPATSGATMGAGIAVGFVLDSMAQSVMDKTGRKAIGFESLVRDKFAANDITADLVSSIHQRLQHAGVTVTELPLDRSAPPILWWPARGPDGASYRSKGLNDSSSTNADLLIQLSPVAFYSAPGAFYSYKPVVSVGIAIYNGRTKEFLGQETIVYSGTDLKSYLRYDELVADIDSAIPGLHRALLSLAPDVSELVLGRSRPPK